MKRNERKKEKKGKGKRKNERRKEKERGARVCEALSLHSYVLRARARAEPCITPLS